MGSWMERNAGDGQGLVHAVVNRGPRPNDSPDAAKRPLRHRRASTHRGGFRHLPGSAPHAFRHTKRSLGPRARRGLVESPVTLRIFVWTERRARCTGRVWPMRQAHGSGTRRCSYRFCHRDRSASTRPMPTNLAGPARTPWQGSPRITLLESSCPDPPSAVPTASGFRARLSRTCPIAGGTAARPGSECPSREGGPGGPVDDTQHLFVTSQGPRTNAETFEPDDTMTLRDRGTAALEPTREGELVPWTRDAIHRVAERPDMQAGG